MVLYCLLFVSFCFNILFIYLLLFFPPYLLKTGLFHCELHHVSGLIVEKVLTLLLQFWRQMVYDVLARVIKCCDVMTTVCITSVFKMVDSIDEKMV